MDSKLNNNWKHWKYRRSHKIKPLNYLYIILLSILAFFPLLQNSLLWNEYDEVNRSFFPTLDSWISIFCWLCFLNENPIALASYFIEKPDTFAKAFTHRFINILCIAHVPFFLYRLLNRMHVPGALLTSLIFLLFTQL